jgi:aspartate-semialdehyde dehydrogenase
MVVEEANAEALGPAISTLCLFSIRDGEPIARTRAARGERRRDRGRKSSAYRLADGVPLVVPEVNGAAGARARRDRRQPELLHDPADLRAEAAARGGRLRRVRVATYQSVSGAGRRTMERSPASQAARARPAMDWDFDGEEFDEETKLREETRKIMELPELPISANCVRVPVMVGHAEAVWSRPSRALADDARDCSARPGVQLEDFPSPGKAKGIDEVLVGRIRRDPTEQNGLVLFLACDNLRKGAALERDPDRGAPARQRTAGQGR